MCIVWYDIILHICDLLQGNGLWQPTGEAVYDTEVSKLAAVVPSVVTITGKCVRFRNDITLRILIK